MELISVIINVYNGEKFIKKCLDSVVNQTYKNLEILIINDGSTDSTLKICKSYKDKRIKIITTENQGLSLSRNVGIDNAKGEYLYFIDVDDFIKLDTIEYLYLLCKKYNVDFSSCMPLDIYNYNFKEKQKDEHIFLKDKKEYLEDILLSINRSGTMWNKLIKRELFDNLRFENRISDDLVVVYKLALKIDRCAYSNKRKYYYFRHSESTLAQRDPKRAIDQYKASLERYNYIKNIYPDMAENDISFLYTIIMVFNHNAEIVDKFLIDNNAQMVFKKLFSLKKIIKSRLNKKEKIKIILYRISPKLERLFQKKYKDLVK